MEVKPTTLYLLRHGATRANLETPYRLQGRTMNPALDPVGVRQAELTRDALADTHFDLVFSSPLRRARQTATIITAGRGLRVQSMKELIECDLGRWERKTWEEIRRDEPEVLKRFEKDPARVGYPDGESFADVAARVIPFMNELLTKHVGRTLLVIGHHVINRVYLASLLGVPPAHAKRVKLDNCGISIVTAEDGRTQLRTLNAAMHLIPLAPRLPPR